MQFKKLSATHITMQLNGTQHNSCNYTQLVQHAKLISLASEYDTFWWPGSMLILGWGQRVIISHHHVKPRTFPLAQQRKGRLHIARPQVHIKHCTLHSVHFAQCALCTQLHCCALQHCALIISQDWCKKCEYFIQPLLVVNRENLAKIGKNQQSGAQSICNQIQMELSRLLLKVNNPTICLLQKWVQSCHTKK